MNKKLINKLFILGLIIVPLVSCENNNNNNTSYTILSPQGAPTLALYDEIIKGTATTTPNTSDIPLEMQKTDSYDFVVFDSINALKLIHNAKKANYTYLEMLTTGNFYLVGLNKSEGEKPEAGDYVVSFGEGGVTDETFKYLFPEIYDGNYVHYVQAVSDVAPIIMSGKHENNTVDWCFFAQPALFNVLNNLNNDDNPGNDINVFYNVLDLVKEKSNNKLDFIPQAGLFVKNSFLENNPDVVNNVKNNIKKSMDNIINNYEDVYDTIKKLDQNTLSKFGTLNLNIFNYYKENTYKEFGITTKDDISISDINEFLTTIGSTTKINN